MAGLLDIFGGGGGGAEDPYADILTPAQRNHMQAQGLLAMAGAFADAGMPSRLPIPFGSALGKAAAALGTGQEAGMKTAIENALAAQKVRDLRNLAQYRTQFFGDQDKLYKLLQEAGGLGPGAPAAPGTRPTGTTPAPGTYVGPGTPPGAGGGGGLPSTNLALASDADPDAYTRGMTAPGAGGVGRFDASAGLLNYPGATEGMAVGGAGLLSQAPFDPGLRTETPSSLYRPGPGGDLYPFKALGVVPSGAGAATPAPSAMSAPGARAAAGRPLPVIEPRDGGGIYVNGAAYPDVKAWTADWQAKGIPLPDPAALKAVFPPSVLQGFPGSAPVPEVTSTPGGTNGIDPRRRAALDAILGGMQTAQTGPSAGQLPQFAGPGAADAPAADTVPEGGGLLGVPPDLRAPIEANPLARVNAVLAQIRQRESGGNYAIPPEQNVDFPRSHASGGYQFQPGTWRSWTAKSGFGQEYPQAYQAPPAVQDAVARYAALHGDVNAPSLWGASAGRNPYPNPQEGGGGPLPPDEVIPSGPAAGGNRPPVMQAQYAPGAGGAPGAAPGATLLPGGTPMPNIPQVPGADNRLNTLLLELARRNAAAEVLGMGNPYGSLLTVLQGSPQYKSQVEAATEQARRAAGLPYVYPEAREKALGGQEVDLQAKAYQSGLDRVTNQIKDMGAAALDPAGTILVNGPNGPVERQVNRLQKAAAQAGFDVPEIGFKGMNGPAPAGQIPGLGPAPGAQAQGAAPGGPGTLYDKPYLNPGQTKSQEDLAAEGVKALQQTHAAELAANRSDQKLGQIAQAMEGFQPGATAAMRLRGGQILKGLGFNVDGVSDGEIMQQAMTRMQVDAASVHQGQTSNYERELFKDTVTQLGNTPQGVAQAIAIQQRLNAYDKQIAAIHRDTIQNGAPNLVEAQRRIAALGPPLSPGETSALEKIRAGKVPGQGAARPAPAIGTVQDGHSFKGGNPADPDNWQKVP